MALTIHASLGLLLIVGGLTMAVSTLAARRWLVAVLALAGLACLVLATMSGARFATTGETGASMLMAVLTCVALACYVLVGNLS